MRPQCGAVFRLPCRRVAVYTNQVPRYHRDTMNIPSNVRGQMQSEISTIKRELKRILNDIKLPNQIFLAKPNTSHGCDLRSRPGSVAIPKSGTQRHINSFLPRSARLLLLWSVYFYLPLLEIYLIVFHSICFSPLIINYVIFEDG